MLGKMKINYPSILICYLFSIIVSSLPVDDSDLYAHTKYQVRLVGDTPFKGRLEVYYEGEWGTVCDDNFTPYGCSLVCKQLGFWNGTCISIVSANCLVKKMGDFEVGGGRIWLDDVNCNGYELHFDECQHSPWGKVNCFHEEDVGCVCTPHQDQCNSSRHRIIPIDESSSYGIVEVEIESGLWGAVCDDAWDDFDAAVLCKCLGYQDVGSYRAISAGRPIDAILNYQRSIVIDEVHCPRELSFSTMNLWDCKTTINNPSKCDPHEIALVQCDNHDLGHERLEENPDQINTTVVCDEGKLTFCIHPLFDFEIKLAKIEIYPLCDETSLRDFDEKVGFCYNIDLQSCPPIKINKNESNLKNYCYDISFKVPDNLFLFGGMKKRVCCSIDKNVKVENIFRSLDSNEIQKNSKSYVSSKMKPKLSIPCFQMDSSEMKKLSNRSSAIKRGSTIYCKVVADIWDENLKIVVNSCKFSSVFDDSNYVSSYTFIKDKCVITDLLNVKMFNGGKHFWAMSFYLPKFESHDTIFLSCDVFLCDLERDSKQLCDRSCSFTRFTKNNDNITTAFDTSTSTFQNITTGINETIGISNDSTATFHNTSYKDYDYNTSLIYYDYNSSILYYDYYTSFEDYDNTTTTYSNMTDMLNIPVVNGSVVEPNRKRRSARMTKGNQMMKVLKEGFILVNDTGVGPLILKSGALIIEELSVMNTLLKLVSLIIFEMAIFGLLLILFIFLIMEYIHYLYNN